MSTELIGILSVGVALAGLMWAIYAWSEKRSDEAHKAIGENIQGIKTELREDILGVKSDLREDISNVRADLRTWIGGKTN